MLKKHNRFFLTSQILVDTALVSTCWGTSTYLINKGYFKTETPGLNLNFGEEGLMSLDISTLQLNLDLFGFPHLLATLGILYCFFRVGLYNSFRGAHRFSDLSALVKAILYFSLPAWCITTIQSAWSIPWQFAASLAGSILLIIGTFRTIERFILQTARAKGYNQRHILIIGAGRHARELASKINQSRWMGFNIIGFLEDNPSLAKQDFYNIPVLGPVSMLKDIINQHKVDQVYCALPYKEMDKALEVSNFLSKTTCDFRIVPDLISLTALNTSLFEIDGLPVLGVRESPLQGFGIFQKRIFDIVFSIFAILFLSPLMLSLAFLVKATSSGPVFYRQTRIGYDGKEFNILKFRSMTTDAEDKSGPVWATKNDARTTKLGAFMRKTSLDELPQFFNVLAGSMSVVGPRPERPEFTKNFTEEIPRYMLRNKTKAGITGWAQVNGWRGDTSLKKRVQYDLYYIENWSIWFDLRIVIDTIIRGFVHKNAY